MPTQQFKNSLLSNVHCSWIELLSDALRHVDPELLDKLESDAAWLPGPDCCFAAFSSVPRCDVKVVWLGESPYPRPNSATGLSFYDGRAQGLFRANGELNGSTIGTSMLNILKAWFVAIGRLTIDNDNPDLPSIGIKEDQQAIRKMNRTNLINGMSELFTRGQAHGWLWLNATLSVWPESDGAPLNVRQQTCMWLPLIKTVLRDVSDRRAKVVLLGEHAKEFAYMVDDPLTATHPRNYCFVRDVPMRKFLRHWSCLIENAA